MHGDPLERIDLSPLRPDPERWDRMVAGVVLRARLPALPVRGPLALLAAWSRPTLAAAAAVAGVSVAALAGLGAAPAAPAPSSAPSGLLAEALNVPQPAEAWLVEERAPERRDVLVALDEMP